jgi:hypothetical protein
MNPTSKRLAPLALLPLAALAASLGGCGRQPQDQLQGNWVGQSVRTSAAVDLTDANAWVRDAAFRFAEGSVSVTIPEGTKVGTFKVAKTEGDRLALDIRDRDNKAFPTDVRVVSDKELHWQVDPKTVVVFKRESNSARN